MSTLRLTTISNQTGSSSVPSQTVISGSAKAWVNFNGTGTVAIRASFNVSSITDNGTGQYTVNFTNALADTNYAANTTGDVGGVGDFAIACTGDSELARTVSALRVRIGTTAGAASDSSVVSVSVFR
jgi:hypothetical protein